MYKDVPDCNKGKLSATSLLFVGLRLHCDNKNAENATQSSLLKKYFPSCLLNYKLYSKKQTTCSNPHDRTHIKLFMVITHCASRRLPVVTRLPFIGQLFVWLFLTVCMWPVPELCTKCIWSLHLSPHHQPFRHSWNILLRSIFCAQ